MTDDVPSPSNRSWFERIAQALSREPQDLPQLIEIIRDAEQRQILDLSALKMIEGVLQISDITVEEIMIPRTDMVVIPKDARLQDILTSVVQSAHSRFPVVGDSKDEVMGILLAKELLHFQQAENQERFNIKDLIRPAIFIPESKRLDSLLNEFRKNRNHLAIVVDEYGGVSGMVTIEDILEQIVGDIEDEHDVKQDPFIKKHKDNHYSLKGQTPIEDFNEYFNLNLSDEEFDTIGGLLLKGFGHLPKRGESITIEGIPFTVLRSSRRKIQLLKMMFPAEPKTESQKS